MLKNTMLKTVRKKNLWSVLFIQICIKGYEVYSGLRLILYPSFMETTSQQTTGVKKNLLGRGNNDIPISLSGTLWLAPSSKY